MPNPRSKPWLTRDYGGEGRALNLTTTRLGGFAYHLLRLGGEITGTWAMGPQYPRSYVQFAILLPEGKEEELTESTGIALCKPPTIHLN
jgi:hypothetical protein